MRTSACRLTSPSPSSLLSTTLARTSAERGVRASLESKTADVVLPPVLLPPLAPDDDDDDGSGGSGGKGASGCAGARNMYSRSNGGALTPPKYSPNTSTFLFARQDDADDADTEGGVEALSSSPSPPPWLLLPASLTSWLEGLRCSLAASSSPPPLAPLSMSSFPPPPPLPLLLLPLVARMCSSSKNLNTALRSRRDATPTQPRPQPPVSHHHHYYSLLLILLLLLLPLWPSLPLALQPPTHWAPPQRAPSPPTPTTLARAHTAAEPCCHCRCHRRYSCFSPRR
mmetsp:Transcript_9043/g.17694  ORF Transcript_9043/g.17694 Transcript_9043/m.17694 type:complete len:284 (+) Transcript_9043:369-1220(+)